MRCLMVENDPVNSELAVRVLQSAGHQVDIAQKDATFGAAGDDEPTPDIVLMDLLAAESDGGELLARLRASHRFAGVPVVALTGVPPGAEQKQVKERLEAAGFAAVLTNPINTRTFAAEVAHLAGAALRTTWVG